MECNIVRLTPPDLARRACKFTLHSQSDTQIPMDILYKSEHSPIRTQMFWIELMDIPSFVSVHLVRHNVGVTHYVQTNRDDRGCGDKVVDRDTPVNHAMIINANSLINMARKRLCQKAHHKTREVMAMIISELEKHDEDLVKYMVVECQYRGGLCPEPKSCGRYERYAR